jgi:hypothetical protein
VGQARGLLSVYENMGVSIPLTYAQIVVASLMARACRRMTPTKAQNLVNRIMKKISRQVIEKY